MAARKPLVRVGGKIVQLPAGDTVEGAGEGSAASFSVTASEALLAGDFVEIFASSGAKCRKASSGAGTLRKAEGYVLAAVASGAVAQVFPLGGVNSQLTGLVAGESHFLTAAGRAASAAPTGSGQAVQDLGVALSATDLLTTPGMFIQLA